MLVSTEIAVYYAGRDGVLSILLAGIMSYAYAWGILWICDKVHWNYWGYITKYGGKLWKNIIAIFFIIKYLLLGCMALAVLCRVVRLQVMDELNYIIIFTMALLVCMYGVIKGIEARGRLLEFIYVVMMIPIWVLIIFAIRGTDIYYLTPLFINDGNKILTGAFVLFFLFAPMEMILFLSDNIGSEDCKKVRNIKCKVYGGITYVLIVNLILFVLNVGHLGINTIRQEDISTIGLMKTIRFSNYVLEKQSGIFLIFLITAILLTVMGILGQIVNLAWNISGDKKNPVAVVSLVLILGLGTFGLIHKVDSYENVMATGTKRVEIENREFVDSILIDYQADSYQVIMGFRDETNKGTYKAYDMKDIQHLEQEYKKNSDKSPDYTNLQAIMFGGDIIKDKDVLLNTMDILGRQPGMPENVNVYVAGNKIEEFQHLEDDAAIGSYLSKLTMHNLEYAITTFRDIKNVFNGTEKVCLLSRFVVQDGQIEPDGIDVMCERGYVCEYPEEESGNIRMVYGNQGIYLTLLGNTYRMDKNKYHIVVKEMTDNGIQAKITYSGTLTPMSEGQMTQEEVNVILEKIIRSQLDVMLEQYQLDFLNVHKYLGAKDSRLWLLYSERQEDLCDNMDIQVQTEYRMINPVNH